MTNWQLAEQIRDNAIELIARGNKEMMPVLSAANDMIAEISQLESMIRALQNREESA